VVGRYGGEEFLIVLPETNRESAQPALEQIRARTVRERPGLPVFTVSIGVVAYPEDGSSSEALIRAADQRLYDAKRLGRNRVV
jgi:diguanylate cyclase (GGDEF)-like protein